MAFRSVDPATEETWAVHALMDEAAVEATLSMSASALSGWRARAVDERCAVIRDFAALLRADRRQLAALMQREMGKRPAEGRAEIDKCVDAMRFLAEHASVWLQDEPVAVEAGTRARVSWRPLGTVLAIMPWNFPFWQVVRCAVPALLGGNTVLLKHAPSVGGCALALEHAFRDAGLPRGVFASLFVEVGTVARLIADARVHAVTQTGSERAGRAVAALAGAHLKKSVLELGGSDPFIVLEDADLGRTVEAAVTARFQNAGQSCIAAKRFIVLDAVHDAFVDRFRTAIKQVHMGDALAPLARIDLRNALHDQVQRSVAAGAILLEGGEIPDQAGAWYPATLLADVRPGMPAADEELFGPVAAVMRAHDDDEAITLGNATRYGLGASVWTADRERGERIVKSLASGMGFVNAIVKSDVRLPFGGVKASGFGRELSRLGMLEFMSACTVWTD